jgi:hypothetical protein
LLYSLLYDRPLTRSFHVLGSTAAFLVKAGFLVVWLPLDVYGFRLVLARGWHDRLGQSVWELVCHAVGDQHITGQSSFGHVRQCLLIPDYDLLFGHVVDMILHLGTSYKISAQQSRVTDILTQLHARLWF